MHARIVVAHPAETYACDGRIATGPPVHSPFIRRKRHPDLE